MTTQTKRRSKARSTSASVRAAIAARDEGLFTYRDFQGMPSTAVAATLSRLARKGDIERVSKGVYYKSRPTSVGSSRPSAAKVRTASTHATIQPAGLTAANILGLTTQNPALPEYSTTSSFHPTALQGKAHVITRRPSGRATLSAREAAILEVLRDRGVTSDLTEDETISKISAAIREPAVFERLVEAAETEPPRVRAILGALGEYARKPRRLLEQLRESLNPLSRFDFGVFGSVPTSRRWQAKSRG